MKKKFFLMHLRELFMAAKVTRRVVGLSHVQLNTREFTTHLISQTFLLGKNPSPVGTLAFHNVAL